MEALVSRMLGSSDSGEERSAAAESIISEAEQSRSQQQPNGRAEQQSWQKASSRDGIRLASEFGTFNPIRILVNTSFHSSILNTIF